MLSTVLLWGLLAARAASESLYGDTGLKCDFENTTATDPGCGWEWKRTEHGFRVVTGQEITSLHYKMKGVSGPEVDASNNTQGHFLFLNMQPGPAEPLYVTSPLFAYTTGVCTLQLVMHTNNSISVFAGTTPSNVSSVRWTLVQNLSNSHSGWEQHIIQVGQVNQNITLFIEVNGTQRSGHVAIDNLELVKCFRGSRLMSPGQCNASTHFLCSTGQCLAHSHVCDLVKDCPNGEDEGEDQDCFKVPHGARCDFQDDACGWTTNHRPDSSHPEWMRTNGSDNKAMIDHTYGNESGIYFYLQNQNTSVLGQGDILESTLFHPPPPYHSNESSKYYNACEIRFFKHQAGQSSGALTVFVHELYPKNKKKKHSVFYIYGDIKKPTWTQALITLPHVKYRYKIQIEARRGMRAWGMAVDDITLSPECFGLRVPPNETIGYDYEKAGEINEPVEPAVHPDFINQTYYEFSTCGTRGMLGPTQENCSQAYNGTSVNVTVMKESPFAGVQRWVVPETKLYTVIVRGASGGLGSGGHGWKSMAAEARAVLQLRAGETLHILVGQEGISTCRKKFRNDGEAECQSSFTIPNDQRFIRIKTLKLFEDGGSGGGGGGGTFVFRMKKSGVRAQAILVAAGGGGLGDDGSQSYHDDERNHGHGFNESRPPHAGVGIGDKPAGPGGGWMAANVSDQAGLSLLQGGHGGRSCRNATNGNGDGGYGGGGGGCAAGGGGGGYSGGNAWTERHQHGEGGYSGAPEGTHRMATPGSHEGPGAVYIIPAISGCGCDYRCVALNVQRSRTECVCPPKEKLSGKSCRVPDSGTDMVYILFPILGAAATIFIVLLVVCAVYGCEYRIRIQNNKFQRNKDVGTRRKMPSGADLQLQSLRVDLMTETNPNYEFAGGTATVRDLKQIPREHLRLLKPLGQGAFGEVYQGFYRARIGDAVEMPVAVKTLPQLSTAQAENDFMLEALIMSKFNHPNIVHLIGVCFDQHPRYIVLELLAGGDLKKFLRESRPTLERQSSPLIMKDLLSCCFDVAKGCKYLEDRRFIHRDIAARNCLLTSKGPGRTVKIADFGMAREVYM